MTIWNVVENLLFRRGNVYFFSKFGVSIVIMFKNVTEEVNVDLNSEYMLAVDISDALSERDKVC